MELYFLTFAVAMVSSVLSGMAGGGGGFIMAPFWLLIGLSPVQGAAIGSAMAIGMGGGSLAAFRGSGQFRMGTKRLLITLLSVAFVASILGAFILPHIPVTLFKRIIAYITIAALPLLFIKRQQAHRLAQQQILGLTLLIGLIIISSIIMSSAFMILMALTLTVFFDLTILQTTVLRRMIATTQCAIIFALLLAQGHLLIGFALAGTAGGIIGGYVGTKYALKKGDVFAKWALAAMAFAGAGALLI